jgi:hypothetical protein
VAEVVARGTEEVYAFARRSAAVIQAVYEPDIMPDMTTPEYMLNG